MITIRLPAPLRAYTQDQKEVLVDQNRVDRAMQQLIDQYPDLRPHLYDSNGELRSYLNLFLNGTDVRTLAGLQTQLEENDQLLIVPSIAGGYADPWAVQHQPGGGKKFYRGSQAV